VYDYGRRPANYTPLILGIVSVLIVFVTLQLLRGVPQPEVIITFPESSPLGEARQPKLPGEGSSIVAVDGLGILGAAGPTQARPIASITKMMTAYVILKSHPLQPGQTGPVIELTTRDAARWLEMLAQDQSSLPVTAGQRLTQLQLLQGMLVPSANNYAEVLANWDAGSVSAFVQKMNAEAQALGMKDTRYADTSGFSAASVSTPGDQLVLARAVMKDPVFAAIVGTEQVNIPGVGTVSAVNQLLGVDGVIGIKTGFTEEAGGNLAFAAKHEAAGAEAEINVYGVVLGQEDRPMAFSATRTVLASLDGGLELKRVITTGQPIATVETEWGASVDLVVKEDVSLLAWPGLVMTTTVELDGIKPGQSAGEQVGWLNVMLGEQARRLPLVLAKDLDGAGVFWRLSHF
jgi:D-alanyl-D-alanine carboxypeptidase (penicillin-binding protein 5/6)